MSVNDGFDERLAGLRALGTLSRDELRALGEEAVDLAKVIDLGVPPAPIWVVGLSAEAEGRTVAAVAAALRVEEPAPVVELSGFFATHALELRCRRVWPGRVSVRRGEDLPTRVAEMFRVLDSEALQVALAGARTEAGVRITVRDEGPCGWAASIDPASGDPEVVAVGVEGEMPWRLDRKTMRVVGDGSAPLPAEVVARAADLADRAQLALGRPVRLRFGHRRGRLVVHGVRPFTVAPSFTDSSFRRVAMLQADEGPIAPLAIDALDRALRGQGDDEARVSRHYARAYRRADVEPARERGSGISLLRAGQRAMQVAADLAAPAAAVRAFEEQLAARLHSIDREVPPAMDAAACLAALRDRQRLVVDVFTQLESARLATWATVSALESVTGALPRDAIHALSAIRKTRTRRRGEEKLLRLARHLVDQLGEVPEPHRIPATLRRRWDDTRTELAGLRPLGVDVRPLPYGHDDDTLRAGLLDVLARDLDGVEVARRETLRRLLVTARLRPLGRAREGLVIGLTVALAQLAELKGRLGEALAESMLRLRQGGVLVGSRLAEAGTIDAPEDALYLELSELEEAVSGEPGAYAARVRLRREADLRWRHDDPPRRLTARAR